MLFLVDQLWSVALQVLWLAAGGSARLSATLARRTGPGIPTDIGFTLIYGLIARLLSLPLAYWRGYVIEHRYGLSTQSHRAWAIDVLKATGLGLLFELPTTAFVYWTIRRYPRSWWLVLSSAALPFTVLLAQIYPVLIAPIFNKFVPLRDPDLAERIRGLAARAGVPIADVSEMDMSRQTRKANAYFAGMGRTKRIALGDTLIEQFTPDEVEVIVAHELGHQVHRDIWKGVALGTIATLGSAFLVSRVAPGAIRATRHRTGIAELGDIASSPLLALVMGAIALGMMPLTSAFSRHLLERPADRYALELTGRPDAFESSMTRLARLNLQDPDPPRLIKLLLHSHPTVAERIAVARQFHNTARD